MIRRKKVIKARPRKRRTGRDLQRILVDLRIPEATLDRIDEVVKARRLSPARAPKL